MADEIRVIWRTRNPHTGTVGSTIGFGPGEEVEAENFAYDLYNDDQVVSIKIVYTDVKIIKEATNG